MNNALKKFYYRFYTPLPMAESEQEIETCHQQLIERLEKPEKAGVADHGRTEPHCRGTLYAQFPLRIPIGMGIGIRVESL